MENVIGVKEKFIQILVKESMEYFIQEGGCCHGRESLSSTLSRTVGFIAKKQDGGQRMENS